MPTTPTTTPDGDVRAGAVRRVVRWVTGESSPAATTVAAWALLVVLTLGSALATVTWDHTDYPTTGDENTYLLQALSLAFDGHNLSYDAADADRWRSLGLPWSPEPTGIYFRTSPEAFTAAKPYGYPLYLAPFIAVAGFATGLAVANTVLLVAVVVVSVAILRTRMTGPGVPMLAAAFVFGSALYLYAYAISVELLFAVGVGVATLGWVRWWHTRRLAWAAMAFVTVGFLAAEKPNLALVLCVPGALVVWHERGWLRRAVGPALLVATFAVAVLPWLHYSGGQSYSPYAAPRHFTWTPIFEQVSAGEFRASLGPGDVKVGGSSVFSVSGVAERLTRDVDQVPASAALTVVGRHTGLLAWAPLSLAAIAAGIWGFRRLDAMGRALLMAIVGYLVMYVLLFTRNYFGGAHSLGNRYFVQASPIVVGLLAQLGWTARRAVTVAAASMAISLVMLWPHHTDPRWAYLRIDRTSAVQQLLPFGPDLTPYVEFRCPGAYGYRFECWDTQP